MGTSNLGLGYLDPSVDGSWGDVLNADLDLLDILLTSTTPSTQALGDSPIIGVSAFVARADHKHAMPNFTFQDANLLVNPSFEQHLDDSNYGALALGWIGRYGLYLNSGSALFSETSETDNSGTSLRMDSPSQNLTDWKVYQYLGQVGPGEASNDAKETCPYRGKIVSGSIRVKSASATIRAFFECADGTVQYSSYHPGDNAWHTLSIAGFVIPGTVLWARFGVVADPATSFLYYLDNACVVAGSTVINYFPRHPADDVAKTFAFAQSIVAYCSRLGSDNGYYYVLGVTGAVRMISNGLPQTSYFGHGYSYVYEEGASVDAVAGYGFSMSAMGPGSSARYGMFLSKLRAGSKPREAQYSFDAGKACMCDMAGGN